MSNQSFMEKLLEGFEVEWKTLGDITVKISSGGTPNTATAEYYSGDIPWLRTQEVINLLTLKLTTNPCSIF